MKQLVFIFAYMLYTAMVMLILFSACGCCLLLVLLGVLTFTHVLTTPPLLLGLWVTLSPVVLMLGWQYYDDVDRMLTKMVNRWE